VPDPEPCQDPCPVVLIKVKVHPCLDLNFAGSRQKKNGLCFKPILERTFRAVVVVHDLRVATQTVAFSPLCGWEIVLVRFRQNLARAILIFLASMRRNRNRIGIDSGSISSYIPHKLLDRTFIKKKKNIQFFFYEIFTF
jgi:hypothetical protein